MELSFGRDSFARAFLQISITIIKYVSRTGSCISWSGVVCHRFAFTKKAGWLEKTLSRSKPIDGIELWTSFLHESVPTVA